MLTECSFPFYFPSPKNLQSIPTRLDEHIKCIPNRRKS